MKRKMMIIFLGIVSVLCVTITGCAVEGKSQAQIEMEKAQENLRRAQSTYEKQVDEYDQLQDDLDSYNKMLEKIKDAN